MEARAIIADEQRKKNHQLARELMKAIQSIDPFAHEKNRQLDLLPRDDEKHLPLVETRESTKRFDDLITAKEIRAALDRIVEEFSKQEILRAHGLKPKTKLLFCGPPGCGKTLSAEILSTELGVPLLYTRFDALVSSYLGATAGNLRKVFNFASDGRWIIFFDEFDAIGKARDDTNDHGELKRVVNSFLQMLDSFNGNGIVIAATNHQHTLDSAIWRRFDEVLHFGLPTDDERKKLITFKLRNFPMNSLNLNGMVSKTRGMSHADIERICFDAVKTALLRDDSSVTSAFLRASNMRRCKS